MEPLIAALENRGARLAAIIALGRLRDERAVEPLITILQEGKGPSDSVQEALARIGTPRAIESVVERIDHMWPGPELSNVFHVLQTLGESSVSLLVPMLESENRYVRRQADLALTNIGWQPDGQAEQSDAPERHATSGEDTPQGQVEQTEWQERPQTDDCDHGHESESGEQPVGGDSKECKSCKKPYDVERQLEFPVGGGWCLCL